MATRRQWPDGGHREPQRSLDEVLELLSQYQRREIVRYLREGQADRSLDRLVEHLVDVEREHPGQTPGFDHMLSVLVHIHGPKLEEAGVIEYDVTSREVRYLGDEQIERALEAIDDLADEL
ncbi:MAG: hypothetical protein ABEJ31_14855 [Haloarculaceae archaeon]